MTYRKRAYQCLAALSSQRERLLGFTQSLERDLLSPAASVFGLKAPARIEQARSMSLSPLGNPVRGTADNSHAPYTVLSGLNR